MFVIRQCDLQNGQIADRTLYRFARVLAHRISFYVIQADRHASVSPQMTLKVF
jgi:hypothetical protein